MSTDNVSRSETIELMVTCSVCGRALETGEIEFAEGKDAGVLVIERFGHVCKRRDFGLRVVLVRDSANAAESGPQLLAKVTCVECEHVLHEEAIGFLAGAWTTVFAVDSFVHACQVTIYELQVVLVRLRARQSRE